MTAGVDAVIFDWGGTLTPWHTIDFAECWQACGFAPEAAQRLLRAEAEVWRRAAETQRSGTIEEVFASAGVTVEGEALAAYYAWWEQHTYTDPDVRPLLVGLRERGIRVGVLSNTLWPRQEHERVFARDGVLDLLDGAVYTSEIHWTKPHPEAFAAALEAVGSPHPARTVFVGDRPFDDIYGAKAAGLRAVLLPHSDIPADQRGPVAGEPDAVLRRLVDLLAIVDGWR